MGNFEGRVVGLVGSREGRNVEGETVDFKVGDFEGAVGCIVGYFEGTFPTMIAEIGGVKREESNKIKNIEITPFTIIVVVDRYLLNKLFLDK